LLFRLILHLIILGFSLVLNTLYCWYICLFVCSRPEESLTQRTITLVARVEPLANAPNMELVHAVFARQRRQASICAVEHAIADRAILHAVHLVVDVGLPHQDSADDVAIARLDEVADRQGPFAHLARLELELVCQVDNHRLKWVLGWDLELDLDRDLVVLVVGRNDLLSALVQDKRQLVLSPKLQLSHLNLLDFILHDGRADNLLDVRLGDGQELLVTGIVEFARQRGEALHEADQSVQGHEATIALL